MNNIITVAVLGSTGYVGLELVKILNNHPNVRINFLGCSKKNKKSISNFDTLIDDKDLPNLEINDNFNPLNSDIVFLALPHGISSKYVKKYFNKLKIIDLSADFRLDSKNTYKLNYNNEHSCPDLLNKFLYGLPEIYKKDIENTNLNIAIPGCYPTSILIPLIPLIQNNLIENNNIIIDSKSGYSGAGKTFNLDNIKNSIDFNFYNYNTNNHRHICEIKQELNRHSSEDVSFTFNPHILPVYRGMMSTIYCDLKDGINYLDIKDNLKTYTKNLSFVNFLEDNSNFDFFRIQNTNNCFLKLYEGNGKNKIIIVSIIDNLIKGAAGQAVQCFNLLYKFHETLSLTY